MSESATPSAPRFTRRQALAAGGVVAGSVMAWIYLRSRRSAGEPPIYLVDSGDAAGRAFQEALLAELRQLGAQAVVGPAPASAMGPRIASLQTGVYALVAAGRSKGDGSLAVVAEIRDAAWHTGLWVQRRRMEAARPRENAALWFTLLASTMASASRGVFAAKTRANPAAAAFFQNAIGLLKRQPQFLLLAEGEAPARLTPQQWSDIGTELRRALDVDPDFHLCRGYYALAFAMQGDWERTRAEAIRATQGEERLWAANLALGLAQLQLNDPRAGCRYLARCLELSPFHVEVLEFWPPSCTVGKERVAEAEAVLPRLLTALKRT